jgi:hypothetical protein
MSMVRLVIALIFVGISVSSRADEAPTALVGEDRVAYLMFADLVPEAINWDSKAKTICFANELVQKDEASESLVNELRSKLAKDYPALTFLQKSQCRRSDLGDVLYLYADDDTFPGALPNCPGNYQAYYSAGGWGGNGHTYTLRDDGVLQRDDCLVSGIGRAP